MANKVKFGISEAYYAVYTPGDNGTYGSYDTPVKLPGAVSLTINREGDENTFYADNIPYFVQEGNSGYSGELTIALAPESVYLDLLGETKGANNLVYETSDDMQTEFALLFQIEGDDKSRRNVFYNCILSRIESEANTKEDTITPDTDKLNIRMMPRTMPIGGANKNVVKAYADYDSATNSAYQKWYTNVQVPTVASA